MLYRFKNKLDRLFPKKKTVLFSTNEEKLPNFFIAGANKAGTSSLYYYCKQHPEIFMSEVKEPMFFTAKGPIPEKNTGDGINGSLFYTYFTLQEYLGLFASATENVRGEASTSYLASPTSAMWIRKLIPDAKLIIILRNPIERAISDFEYQIKRNKTEARTLTEAMTDALNGYISESNINKVGANLQRVPKRYLNLGLYGSQLAIVKQFFPDKQILIADYEEYNGDTAGFVQKVYKFLEVSEFNPPDLSRLNTSGKTSKPQLDKEIEAKMKAFFEKDISLLRTLVDFDVMKWL